MPPTLSAKDNSVIFRAATPSDFAGIAACLARNEMSVPTEEEWRHIWDEHPYAHDFRDVPRGFVLEADGVIVGSIFNLWAKYRLNGRTLRVAISGSAAVDPAHRGGSIKLMGETVRQAGVDLYLNGSPSEVAAKIMDTLKVRRVPQPDYDVSLLWATRGYRLALAGLKRQNVPAPRLVAWPVGIAIQLASRIKAMRGPSHAVTVDDRFSDEFDELWAAIQSQATHLVAFRDRRMLEWRYGRQLARQKARVLTVRRGRRLAGYAVLVRSSRPRLGIEQYAVHDIQCVGEDPDLTAALIRAALQTTRRDGLDLLEWVGHTRSKRAVAVRNSALRYRLNVWQAYYFTRDPELKRELANPERWAFGLYDSD